MTAEPTVQLMNKRRKRRTYAPYVGKNVRDGAKEQRRRNERRREGKEEKRRRRMKEKKRRLSTLVEHKSQVQSQLILRTFLTRGPEHNQSGKKIRNKEQEKRAKEIGTQGITTMAKIVGLMTKLQRSQEIILMTICRTAAIIVAIWLDKGKIFALLAGPNVAADVSD